jgi:hypothetical protein
MKRRDKIAAAWFSKVQPLDRFRVADGQLAFEDLGARYDTGNAREYSITWEGLDGDDRATLIPETTGSRLPAFRGDTRYLAATIKPLATRREGDHPVTVYLRQEQAGPEVVGIDRK